MKKALITGITGQDAAYLAEFCSIKAMKYMALSEDPLCLIRKELTTYTRTHISQIGIYIYIMEIYPIVRT